MSIEAFELVSIIEKLVQSKKSTTAVQSVESWEDNLWVGTNDGFIVYYLLEAGQSPTGKLTYRCGLQQQQHLGFPKPVERMQAIPRHRKLVVHCDGKILLLNMHTLEVIVDSKIIKGVTMFCPNEAIDLATSDQFEITVIRKKGIYQYELNGNILSPHKKLNDFEDSDYREVSLVVRDKYTLCVAQQDQYNLINLRNGAITDLFPFDPRRTKPFATRISPGEFLVGFYADGITMGMFVTAQGNTSRPPLQWSFPPVSIGFHFPYVIGLVEAQGLLTVHSVLDQQNKQVVTFDDGHVLAGTNEQIYIASRNKVCLLAPISYEDQIQTLLKDPKRVREALELARVTLGKSDNDLDAEEMEQQEKKMEAIVAQAGFALVAQGQFQEGFELFGNSNIDPREVIALFPDMLSKSTSFTVVPVHDRMKSITEAATSENLIKQAEMALLQYLNTARSAPIVKRGWIPDIDTALAKLYAVHKPSALLQLLAEPSNKCQLEDLTESLKQNSRFHALSVLYLQHGLTRQALAEWKKLEEGETRDKHYPGIEHVIAILCKVTDEDIVFTNAKWILHKSAAGVEIFTEREWDESSTAFGADKVLDFLRDYGDACRMYLEYLVFTAKLDNERYHTRLALIYLDHLQRKKIELENKQQVAGDANMDEMKEASEKLRHLLKWSSKYHVETILNRIKGTELYQECAILHGKLGQHSDALSLLVHKLGDYNAAMQYCYEATAARDRRARQDLFLALLQVYLNPGSDGKDHTMQAMELLNSHIADLNLVKVLDMVPQDWGIGVLDKFLRRSIRRNLHEHCTKQVHRALARQEHIAAGYELGKLQSRSFVVRENSKCGNCGRLLNESAVAVYPNGTVTHARCARDKTTCPVTGERFS